MPLPSFAFALGAIPPFVVAGLVVVVAVVVGCFPPEGCVVRVAECDPPVGCSPGAQGWFGPHLPLGEHGGSIFGQLVTMFPLFSDGPVDSPCRMSMGRCALVGGWDVGDLSWLCRFLI